MIKLMVAEFTEVKKMEELPARSPSIQFFDEKENLPPLVIDREITKAPKQSCNRSGGSSPAYVPRKAA
jgi:hypothetical protein